MKFRALYNKILSENHIDFSSYSLEEKYSAFNKLLFGGELPNVPIRWGTLKGVGGITKATFKRTSNIKHPFDKYYGCVINPESINVVISNIVKRSENELDKVLVHEMIHVYFLYNNMPQEKHGIRFKAMAEKLSGIAGFQIPLTDDIEVYDTDLEIKSVGVILASKKNGEYSVALVKPQLLIDHLNDVSDYLTRFLAFYTLYTSLDLYVISSKNWFLLSKTVLPIQSYIDNTVRLTFSKLLDSYIKVPTSDLVQDLQTNGKHLDNIKRI